MCFADQLDCARTSTDISMHRCVEYQVHFLEQEERIDPLHASTHVASRVTSIETSPRPPAYEECAATCETEARAGKGGFFRRLFHRSQKKANAEQELPSYRETELARAWAKVGINIHDPKQGPPPACTPDEWIRTMKENLFI